MNQDEWEKLRADVQAIKVAIIGDDLGNRGIARRLEDAERAIGAVTIRVIVISAFVSGVIWAVKFFISK